MKQDLIYISIVNHLGGKASPEEEKRLLEWLEQSEENRKQFRSLKDAYDLGQFENNVKDARTQAQWKKLYMRIQADGFRRKARRRKTAAAALRYAAVFIVGVMLSALGYYMVERFADSEPELTLIETGVGERSKITLPDNSVVWLNSCSSVTYDRSFGKKSRDIDLSGEAFFEVHKNQDKPFRVHSSNLTYRVTGTSFNIYSFGEDRIETLVLVEGGVTLEHGKKTLAIKPGEVVEFDRESNRFLVKHSDPAFYTNWRFGELAFERMTFEELARRLERNFNVTFVFQNEKVRNESFGGTFRNYDSLETILKVISTSTPIKYRIDQNTVYIR